MYTCNLLDFLLYLLPLYLLLYSTLRGYGKKKRIIPDLCTSYTVYLLCQGVRLILFFLKMAMICKTETEQKKKKKQKLGGYMHKVHIYIYLYAVRIHLCSQPPYQPTKLM